MSNLSELTKLIIDFRDKREWKQFHNPKDVAISLVLEATELLEIFQWKNTDEIAEYINNDKSSIAEELADVLYWVVLMSHDLNIDVLEALKTKMIKNEEKYPINKSKGNHLKYTEFNK